MLGAGERGFGLRGSSGSGRPPLKKPDDTGAAGALPCELGKSYADRGRSGGSGGLTGRKMHTPSTAPSARRREDAAPPLPGPALLYFLFRAQPLTVTEYTVRGDFRSAPGGVRHSRR